MEKDKEFSQLVINTFLVIVLISTLIALFDIGNRTIFNTKKIKKLEYYDSVSDYKKHMLRNV